MKVDWRLTTLLFFCVFVRSKSFTLQRAPVVSKQPFCLPLPKQHDARSFVATGSNTPTRNNPRRCTCRLGMKETNTNNSSSSILHVTIREMLWRMTCYLSSMVDTTTHRFYLISRPPTGEQLYQHCPIRELAAAWDATTALLFWETLAAADTVNSGSSSNADDDDDNDNNSRRLVNAICQTIQIYKDNCVPMLIVTSVDETNDNYMAIDSNMLQEPSNIAHSGMLLLAYVGAMRLSLMGSDNNNDNNHDNIHHTLEELTRGILSMQQAETGAFEIEFFNKRQQSNNGGGNDDDDDDDDTNNSNIYKGIAFFPGEAMVALLEVYFADSSSFQHNILTRSTREAIPIAIKQALKFYANHYRERDTDTNYNIWQVQAFARFFHAVVDDSHLDASTYFQTAEYVLDLCQGILASSSWKMLARGKSFYPNLQTVEIACGLDAIVEGIRVASVLMLRQQQQQDDEVQISLLLNSHLDVETLLHRFWMQAENAVYYLKYIQDQVPVNATVGSGGLGYGGVQVLEQRLDVTGHAISALTKLYHTPKYSL